MRALGLHPFRVQRVLSLPLVVFCGLWGACADQQETPGVVLTAAQWAPELPVRFQSSQGAIFLERYEYNCLGCHSYQGRAARVSGTPAPALETVAAKVLATRANRQEARAYLHEVLSDTQQHWKTLHDQFAQMGLKSRLDLTDADRSVLIDALMAHAP